MECSISRTLKQLLLRLRLQPRLENPTCFHVHIFFGRNKLFPRTCPLCLCAAPVLLERYLDLRCSGGSRALLTLKATRLQLHQLPRCCRAVAASPRFEISRGAPPKSESEERKERPRLRRIDEDAAQRATALNSVVSFAVTQKKKKYFPCSLKEVKENEFRRYSEEQTISTPASCEGSVGEEEKHHLMPFAQQVGTHMLFFTADRGAAQTPTFGSAHANFSIDD